MKAKMIAAQCVASSASFARDKGLFGTRAHVVVRRHVSPLPSCSQLPVVARRCSGTSHLFGGIFIYADGWEGLGWHQGLVRSRRGHFGIRRDRRNRLFRCLR